MNKQEILKSFIDRFADLPIQGSEQWLINRKFTIGGSDMPILVGANPYSNIRELIEQRIGLRTFTGNMYTKWGSVLEVLVVKILEKEWKCKVYETGSLPGVVPGQKYSPDGLLYIDFINKIVLIEIKCAARRAAANKIPKMYLPQLLTGLDTIRIADIGLFIDVMFRRCSIQSFMFNTYYDYAFHSRKYVELPIALCAVCMYEEKATDYFNAFKEQYNTNGWVDIGGCSIDDMEFVFNAISSNILKVYYPSYITDSEVKSSSIIDECIEYCESNEFNIISILPLKIFEFKTLKLDRNSWRKKKSSKSKSVEPSYVESHKCIIDTVIQQIRNLDGMEPEEQKKELDILYPPKI